MTDPVTSPEPPRETSAFGADLIVPLLAAGAAIYFLVDTRSLVWEARANGTVLAGVLLTLVLVHVIRLVARLRRGEASPGLGALVERSPVQGQRLALLAIVCVFIATIPWLGTTLGIFLSLLTMMWVLGVRSWRPLLFVSLAVALTVYILFMVVLQSRLPSGPVERALGLLFGLS